MMPAPRPTIGRRATQRAEQAAARRRTVDVTVPIVKVDLPIDRHEVSRIASKGYPLWESLEVMQLRNRRITVAYADLSRQLAELVAGGDDRLDANWCTYATWSSKTIGAWIDDDAAAKPPPGLRQLPQVVLGGLVAASRYLVQRENGSSYRALAAGNRFVFLEVGQAVSRFVAAFGGVPRDKPNEDDWADYWRDVCDMLDEHAQLDLSWMLTETPPPDDLRLGLRQYYEALFAPDRKARAELMLAGNLLLGAYEQRRVDGYLAASLALFPDRATRRLVQHRSGSLDGWRRWPSRLYAQVMTRGLTLDLPGEELCVAKPVPPPPPGEEATQGELFPPDLRTITLPLLQALLTRWDLSEGQPDRLRVGDWTSIDDRMAYIANLFRARQQRQALFRKPFPAAVERALLEGRLDGGGDDVGAAGGPVT